NNGIANRGNFHNSANLPQYNSSNDSQNSHFNRSPFRQMFNNRPSCTSVQSSSQVDSGIGQSGSRIGNSYSVRSPNPSDCSNGNQRGFYRDGNNYGSNGFNKFSSIARLSEHSSPKNICAETSSNWRNRGEFD